jgi:hypothetical protein
MVALAADLNIPPGSGGPWPGTLPDLFFSVTGRAGKGTLEAPIAMFAILQDLGREDFLPDSKHFFGFPTSRPWRWRDWRLAECVVVLHVGNP